MYAEKLFCRQRQDKSAVLLSFVVIDCFSIDKEMIKLSEIDNNVLLGKLPKQAKNIQTKLKVVLPAEKSSPDNESITLDVINKGFDEYEVLAVIFSLQKEIKLPFVFTTILLKDGRFIEMIGKKVTLISSIKRGHYKTFKRSQIIVKRVE